MNQSFLYMNCMNGFAWHMMQVNHHQYFHRCRWMISRTTDQIDVYSLFNFFPNISAHKIYLYTHTHSTGRRLKNIAFESKCSNVRGCLASDNVFTIFISKLKKKMLSLSVIYFSHCRFKMAFTATMDCLIHMCFA